MLGYLNGIGRVKSGSKTQKKQILKKAFTVLPPVLAVKVAKQIIAKNKNKPNAASQLTQNRALKNQFAKAKATLFIKKNKAIMLDDTDLTDTPALEQSIDDQLMDQEVQNEIEQEQEFTEAEQDLGIIYNTGFLSGKAERKAKKQSKVDLRKAKATAKVNKSTREKKSGKDMFSDVLDSAKKGLAVYKDFKGTGSGDTDTDTGSTSRTSTQTQESFFSKNKTMLLIGGAGLVLGAVLLLKNKNKNK